MQPTSKHATKLPDKKTQACLLWARTAGSFSTLEMAMCALNCETLHDAAHRKAARVLTGYRHLFREIDRSRAGSRWRMLPPDEMPEGVLWPMAEWVNGVHTYIGWGFSRHDVTHRFATIAAARIGLMRNA
jgi:hypothetical protein